MMARDKEEDWTPSGLRLRAARCFALAARLPPSPEAKMLVAVAQEYLAMGKEQEGAPLHDAVPTALS